MHSPAHPQSLQGLQWMWKPVPSPLPLFRSCWLYKLASPLTSFSLIFLSVFLMPTVYTH
jgi:hypothetical protein